MTNIKFEPAELVVLHNLRSISPCPVSKWSKPNKSFEKYRARIQAIIDRKDSSQKIPSLSFEELRNDLNVLRSLVKVVKVLFKNPRCPITGYKPLGGVESLIKKITKFFKSKTMAPFIRCQEKILNKIKKLVHEQFKQCVQGRVQWTNFKDFESEDMIIALKDEPTVGLRDFVHIIQGLEQLHTRKVKLLGPFDQKKIINAFDEAKKGVPSFVNSPNGVELAEQFFDTRIKNLISSLNQHVEENQDQEAEKLMMIYDDHLRRAFSFPFFLPEANEKLTSYCFVGPLESQWKLDVKFNPFPCTRLPNFGAFSCGMPAKKGKKEYNGDAVSFGLLPNGGYLVAVADAAGHERTSSLSSSQLLKSLYKEAERCIEKNRYDILKWMQRFLRTAHFTALKAGAPCTLALFCAFPEPEKKGYYSCFYSIYGDARVYLLSEDLTFFKDCNPIAPSKFSFSSGGSLGDVIVDPIKSKESVLCSMDSIVLPENVFCILGSDGFGNHFEANTLKETPFTVAEKISESSGKIVQEKIDSEDWEKNQNLYQEYKRFLLSKMLQEVPEVENKAPLYVEVLMDHCLDASEQLRKLHAQGKDDFSLPGAVDDITVAVFQLPKLSS